MHISDFHCLSLLFFTCRSLRRVVLLHFYFLLHFAAACKEIARIWHQFTDSSLLPCLQLGAHSEVRQWAVWEIPKRGAACQPQEENTRHQSPLLHLLPPSHWTQVSLPQPTHFTRLILKMILCLTSRINYICVLNTRFCVCNHETIVWWAVEVFRWNN